MWKFCGNVQCESPETLVSAKLTHQGIRCNYGILSSQYVKTNLTQFNKRVSNWFSLFANMKYIGVIEFQEKTPPW